MKTIKVCTNNYSWVTSANGTQKELNVYFVGKLFDVGIYPIEKLELCIKVEILNTYLATFSGRHLNAIGVNERFVNVEVVTVNENDALLKLYDDYESIRSLQLTKI